MLPAGMPLVPLEACTELLVDLQDILNCVGLEAARTMRGVSAALAEIGEDVGSEVHGLQVATRERGGDKVRRSG